MASFNAPVFEIADGLGAIGQLITVRVGSRPLEDIFMNGNPQVPRNSGFHGMSSSKRMWIHQRTAGRLKDITQCDGGYIRYSIDSFIVTKRGTQTD